MKIRKKGLTLMELLLVTALIPVVSLAIYATFNSAIKIYQRINTSLPQEAINLFLSHFYEDLRNSFSFQSISFKADKESISFATLVYDSHFKAKIPGKVLYVYEPYKKILKRKVWAYPELFSGTEHIKTTFLENIRNFNFKYYYYNEEKNAYLWEDNFIYDRIPLAVRMEFEFSQNEKAIPFIYSVWLPAGE